MKTYLVNLTLLIIFLPVILCQSCDDGDKRIGCQQLQFPTERCGLDFGSIKLGCTDVNVTIFHFDKEKYEYAQKTNQLYQFVLNLYNSTQESLSVRESKIRLLEVEVEFLKDQLQASRITEKKTLKLIEKNEKLILDVGALLMAEVKVLKKEIKRLTKRSELPFIPLILLFALVIYLWARLRMLEQVCRNLVRKVIRIENITCMVINYNYLECLNVLKVDNFEYSLPFPSG